MNTRSILQSSIVAIAVVWSHSSDAYEPETHAAITRSAAQFSLIGDGTKLARSALPDFDGKALALSTIKYGDSESGSRDILSLFEFGSQWEDKRSILNGPRHFYNPLTGAGLKVPIATFMPSPDWILGDNGDPGHDFTWKKARSDFLKASIDPDKAVRMLSWGLTFQKLGHVIHHIQDMAQPQHARNDAHCDSIVCLVLGAYTPSNYEKWTLDNRDLAATFIHNSYPTVYPSPSKAINSTRDFWSGSGRGMADFSNANFVSAGTNFIGNSDSVGRHPNFPKPFASRFNRQTMADLQNDPASGPMTPISRVCGGNLSTCTIDFAEVDIVDPLNPAMGGTNKRASSYSIFDQNLKQTTAVIATDPVNTSQWITNRVFALNRYNFVEGYKFLLNRAVAYSAGMINFFFRGELGLKRSITSPTQFAIKNKGPDDMVGPFRLMYDSADGTRHMVPDAIWALSVNAGLESAPIDIDLDVSPASAKSNTFVLVFNGTMGSEADAVAVTEVVVQPPVEGLYVLATDNVGATVVLRVDKKGTRALLPNEFSPFQGVSALAPNNRKYLQKQVAFFITPNGQPRHMLQSLTTINGSVTNYYFDADGKPAGGRTTLQGYGPINWVSRPETNGTSDFYTFSLDSTGEFKWGRSRADGGTPASPTGGAVTLPTSFMGKTVSYYEANFLGAVISPDGLTVYGISSPGESDAGGENGSVVISSCKYQLQGM